MLAGYYNIDSDLDVIQANITEHFNSQKVPDLSDKQWQELTPYERKIWNQLPPKAKSTIICVEDLKRLAVVPTTLPTCSINLHKMSANDLISHIEDWQSVGQGVENVTDVKPQDNDDNKESSILTHVSQRKVLPPGDIQHVLSHTASCSIVEKAPLSKSNSISSSKININDIT